MTRIDTGWTIDLHRTALRGFLAVTLALCLALVPSTRAASRVGNWEAVRQLEEGRRVRVVLPVDGDPRKRRVVKGRFASAADNQVTIVTSDGGTETFPKGGIHQVRVRAPFFNRKSGWIGGLSVGGPYSVLGGYLSGIGGVFGGLFLGLLATYPLFAFAWPTTAVYKGPASAGTAGTRLLQGIRDSSAVEETSQPTPQRTPGLNQP